MSAHQQLNVTLRNLTYSIPPDYIINTVVPSIIASIIASPIVEDKYKAALRKKFGIGNNPTKSNNSKNSMTPEEMMVASLTYYLSDMNKFDHKLVNLGFDAGLTDQDVIVLLIIDDLDSIDHFCQKHGIGGEPYRSIVTLKKLSGLQKLRNMFN